jgi:hypothetical protein
VGDYVLYKNNVPKTKWDPKFYGPWRIIDQISPVVFELALNGYRFSAHAAKLKLYKGSVSSEEIEEVEPDMHDRDSQGTWIQPALETSQEVGTDEPSYIPGPSRSGPAQWVRDRLTYFRRSFDPAARGRINTSPLSVTTVPSINSDTSGINTGVITTHARVTNDNNNVADEETELPIALRRTPRNPPPIQRLTYSHRH